MAQQDVYVGRNRDGDRVYVSATLARTAGEWQTVDHGRVAFPLRLALQGVVIRKGGSYTRDGDWRESGQIDTDHLRAGTETAEGFTRDDLRLLADVWDRWHLNDMRPWCAHMRLPRERSYDARKGITCPTTGYRYGSAWLTAPLPDDVVSFIERLFPAAREAAA